MLKWHFLLNGFAMLVWVRNAKSSVELFMLQGKGSEDTYETKWKHIMEGAILRKHF